MRQKFGVRNLAKPESTAKPENERRKGLGMYVMGLGMYVMGLGEPHPRKFLEFRTSKIVKSGAGIYYSWNRNLEIIDVSMKILKTFRRRRALSTIGGGGGGKLCPQLSGITKTMRESWFPTKRETFPTKRPRPNLRVYGSWLGFGVRFRL